MSVRTKFDALVKGLDEGALEELRESVAAELEDRGAEPEGFRIDAIRAGMSEEEKERAAQEIARVLREA